MTAESATILAGVFSGLLGGGLAVAGALLAVRKGIRDLEQTEIRRQRVLCISNLYGYRYAISDGFSARPEDQAHFMFEMNRAGSLFAHDSPILNDLRDFYDSVKNKAPDGNDRLIHLIKKMGKQTSLSLEHLGDADVKKVFLLPTANTIVQFIPVPVAQAASAPNTSQSSPNPGPQPNISSQ